MTFGAKNKHKNKYSSNAAATGFMRCFFTHTKQQQKVNTACAFGVQKMCCMCVNCLKNIFF